MEKSKSENGGSSSHSWWLHNHHIHQSQWLQSTLSELEKKVKKMLSLLEDDGDSFAKRSEMIYKKRPLLIQSVEDLHQSYRCLAEKYDHLIITSQNQNGSDHERWFSHESPTENDDFEEGWNELRLNVTKLVQDHLEQQVEVVKSNEDDREAIDDLRAHIRKLLVENIELKSKLAHMKALQQNQS